MSDWALALKTGGPSFIAVVAVAIAGFFYWRSEKIRDAKDLQLAAEMTKRDSLQQAWNAESKTMLVEMTEAANTSAQAMTAVAASLTGLTARVESMNATVSRIEVRLDSRPRPRGGNE